VPEVRRVILAMARPKQEREFRLGWSLWRRAHQALAKRSHAATPMAKRDSLQKRPLDLASPAPATKKKPFPTPVVTPLTDEKWDCVRPLMPSQKPATGRPRRDHRQVLAGMLWVLGTGSSWRDLPEEEFGPWRTVYGRYREWRKEGLWQRIMEALRHCRRDADDS
jgi:transposase